MDLRVRPPQPPPRRFPRPRGDGTVLLQRAAAREHGFPAHAGMDPAPCAAGRLPPWFPRPRGDGPEIPDTEACCIVVSPPTRGWTDVRRDGHGVVDGFPAHAGMDHHPGMHGWHCGGFPRPRGDGPANSARSTRRVKVSPPTRGWTAWGSRCRPSKRGFPAHAGMDPPGDARGALVGRFPRPRGDGPTIVAYDEEPWQVSPPTRGWTPSSQQDKRAGRGFPAHAGMDPGVLRRSECSRRFPRPRGDGPCGIPTLRPALRVSPPTRGWTTVELHQEEITLGFPAHAGMDPKEHREALKALRFPRPRGDGPLPRTISGPALRVSPPTRGWTPPGPVL